MKQIIIAISLVTFLASCRKDYVCECVNTTGITVTNSTIDLGKQKKADADKVCIDRNITKVTGSVACTAKEK